jgi:glycosyltransferase involved in cell wall biosynthesis|tara:strand:- start:4987 stop:6201 length:1215 start_codon:yes stop_codon:yes gene_type:complete
LEDVVNNLISKICVIIPTYNNANTLIDVIGEVQKYSNNIIIVNDGSTDSTAELLSSVSCLRIITFSLNKGKGAAIKTGIAEALSLGFEYAMTIDSDGQHYPDDIPKMFNALTHNPDALIIGSRNINADGMPSKNTFANKFSNFWFWAETNKRLPDTQSGFRIYPIKYYKNTKFVTTGFEFEIEILVRSAWKEINIIPIPVKVYYASPENRITHFRPFRDFMRISLLNTVLVLITFLMVLPIKSFRYITRNKFTKVVREQIMLHNENPQKISMAIGFGIFMGIAPIWGFQMIVAAFLAHIFRLNKIIVLIFSNISLPPAIPFIIYFSYQFGSLFFDNPQEFTIDTIYYLKQQIVDGEFYKTLKEFGYSIIQYIFGSLLLGLSLGILSFLISWTIIKVTSGLKENK